MLSKVLTAALYGIEGRMIIVETDITKGLPSYNVVGLGDMVIKEAGPRVRAAIINSVRSLIRHFPLIAFSLSAIVTQTAIMLMMTK